MSTPKHRANKVVRTEPRVQTAGKHVGPASIDILRRATELSIADLMRDVTVANPFSRGRSL
jgi:hypothetical protein